LAEREREREQEREIFSYGGARAKNLSESEQKFLAPIQPTISPSSYISFLTAAIASKANKSESVFESTKTAS
jgi:hypothetical protein